MTTTPNCSGLQITPHPDPDPDPDPGKDARDEDHTQNQPASQHEGRQCAAADTGQESTTMDKLIASPGEAVSDMPSAACHS